MAKKSAKSATKKAAKKSTTAKSTSGKDAAAFVDHLHQDKKLRTRLKKGWDEVIAAGRKKGFNFTRKELYDHLKKRYGLTSMPEEDEPDTCICI